MPNDSNAKAKTVLYRVDKDSSGTLPQMTAKSAR